MSSRAEYKRQWKLNNREREKENNKRWYEANKLNVSARKAAFYLDNAEKEKQRSKDFYRNNPLAKRPKTPNQRMVANVRSKISALMAGSQKRSKSTKYLGCTFEHLRSHIESQFVDGMSWDNYGVNGWHVDHIKPLSAFDLSVESNMYLAWNYTNLRPLWAKDNLCKGKKYVGQEQAPSGD